MSGCVKNQLRIARHSANRLTRVPFVPLLALAAAAWIGAAGPAAATAISIDQFVVGKNGTPIFNDTFSQNTTLTGNGTNVPSGVNFSNGTAADYGVHGTIPESTANNGQAYLDTANGLLTTQPPPFLPTISRTTATLITPIDPTKPLALTPTSAFAVAGLFDLSVPDVVGGTSQIYLTNRYPDNSMMGNVLALRLRNCVPGFTGCGTADGIALQLFLDDFINNTGTLVDQIVLSAADLLNPQMALRLQKGASTDVVSAYYAFGSFATLADVGSSFALLGSTAAGCSDVFTNGCSVTPSFATVRAGFSVFEPVPEPSSFIMMSSALLLLGALVVRRGRRA